jgi:hypothetical protein
MAEYSKQYCDNTDLGFQGDFDIYEIVEELNDNHYIPIICEGYGFIAIGKHEGVNKVAICRKDNEELVDWVELEEFLNKFKYK